MRTSGARSRVVVVVMMLLTCVCDVFFKQKTAYEIVVTGVQTCALPISLDAHAGTVVAELRQGHVSSGLAGIGSLVRIPVDLSDPALAVGEAGYPAGVTDEYYAFVQDSLEKIPVVLVDP